MGNLIGIDLYAPDLPEPDPVFAPKFDPMLGFPNGRKERVVKTTLDEMISAQIPPKERDYCIDYLMDFYKCRRKNFPLVYRCKHEVHACHECAYQDLKLRMKEYERERRLTELAEKKKLAEN